MSGRWRVMPRLLLCVALPLALGLSGLRLASTRTFADLEFRRAGFPADLYGLTAEQRSYWSGLVFDAVAGGDLSALAATRLPAAVMPPGREIGDDDHAFVPREIRHLEDVTRLYSAMAWAWGGSLVLLAVALWWGHASGGWAQVRANARMACLLVLGGCGLLAVAVFLGAERLLLALHLSLFAGDSFVFYGNDTLIRLYPPQYWQDAMTFVPVFAAGMALTLLAAVPRGGA